MKILLYGLERGHLIAEKYLKKEHKIIGYVDEFYKGKVYNGLNVYSKESINDLNFDYIVIAIESTEVRKVAYEDLKQLGIESKKIVDFFDIYMECYSYKLDIPVKKIDRIMSNVNKPLDGIILGISHGLCGINPKYLQKNFCNLAIPSQDLYYNLKQLKHLIKNYREKVENLQYVVIDMFTYIYFNYDISLTKNAVLYYELSGYRDDESHNFAKNKNFDGTISEELAKIQEKYEKDAREKYSREDVRARKEIYNSLFDMDNVDINEDFKRIGIYDRYVSDFGTRVERERVITDEEIEKLKSEDMPNSIAVNMFSETVKENIEIFNEMLKTIFELNKDMKVYLVLIPQYIEREIKVQKEDLDWKPKFYDILDKFKEEYKFEVLDFKDCEAISAKREYYYDFGHLNYQGSMVFTELLNSYIY
ncbi:hypothetical protein [uncultured Clostridium sp.]|uniref:hypothetical protein n=1 Tax=uncultured Clostridium sp. TaxID=59620 RepID=UPI0025D9C71C|nr:hypothetical protein [uncultured Clostridium sp.]